MLVYEMNAETLLDRCLWVDKADALQQLKHKIASAGLDEQEATWITQFITQGYCILPKAIPGELIARAWADLEAAYAAKRPLRCHKQGIGTFSNQEAAQLGIAAHHYAVHDFHNLSPATLAIATHPRFAQVLKTILDNPPILMQSQMFLYGSGKGAHCDFSYYLLEKPLHSATVWVAGEPVTADSGALYLYPKSQNLPPYEFDQQNVLWIQGENAVKMQSYHEGLTAQCKQAGLQKQLFEADMGDVLLFNSRLIHGALPPSNLEATRRSFVFHFSVPNIYLYDHLVAKEQSQLCERNEVQYYERAEYPLTSGFRATPS